MPAKTDAKQKHSRPTDQEAVDRLKNMAAQHREVMAKVRRVPAVHFRRGPSRPKDGDERS